MRSSTLACAAAVLLGACASAPADKATMVAQADAAPADCVQSEPTTGSNIRRRDCKVMGNVVNVDREAIGGGGTRGASKAAGGQ